LFFIYFKKRLAQVPMAERERLAMIRRRWLELAAGLFLKNYFINFKIFYFFCK